MTVSRTNIYVQALRDAVSRATSGEVMSVGRDGASDAASFIEAGIPAVEFGPAGGGHHGPEEWVSVRLAGALSARALRFRALAAGRLAQADAAGGSSLRAVDGGRA